MMYRYLVILIIALSIVSLSAAQEDEIAFSQEVMQVAAQRYTTLTFGPDGRLFGATLFGQLYSWRVAEDGTLLDQKSMDVIPGRVIIGVAFDPASTPENPIIWVTSNWGGLEDAPNFSSEIVKITFENYGLPDQTWQAQPYVVGIPRAALDHMANGLSFGPDGALYSLVGSMSTMGDKDRIWDQRPETALSGALLRIDTQALEALGDLPLDIRTAELDANGDIIDDQNYGLGDPALASLYDPLAPGAPVTLYATGIRNAYDMLWHTNGELYVPMNGSSQDGNVPGTPDVWPLACQHRIDSAFYGDYVGPSVPAARELEAQPDYLLRVEPGGYYGHPNPTRCEWSFFGANPTNRRDVGQYGDHYPVGVQPDRNWRGFAYDFFRYKSPNGVIEYRGDHFNGALRGHLLVVRYSEGDDILALEPGGPDLNIVDVQEGLPGLTGFTNPLDLVEHVDTGNIYVSNFGAEQIVLLRPTEPDNVTLVSNSTDAAAASSEPPQEITSTFAWQIGVIVLAAATWFFYSQRLSRMPNVARQRILLFQGGAALMVVAVLTVPVLLNRRDDGASAQQLSAREFNRMIFEETSANVAVGDAKDIHPEGYDLYIATCAVCHGENALGKQGQGLTLIGSDFVNGLTDDELVEFIKVGRTVVNPANVSGMTMPAYGGNPTLTDEDLMNIVLFLRSANELIE